MLRNLIKDVQSKGAIWSTDWDKMPMPKECMSYAQVAKPKKPIVPPMPKIPVFKPEMPKIPPPQVNASVMQSPFQSVKHYMQPFMQQSLPTGQNLNFQLEESNNVKLSRLKRFSEKQQVEDRKRKKDSAHAAKVREAFIAAGAEGNPDVIDWDEDTVVGTFKNLEKSYLRITSAVDPTTVRPLRVLVQSLDFLIKKWKQEGNYTYICDQLKSVRQDLTVQRIKNEFSVKVYETHARIAIEKVLIF